MKVLVYDEAGDVICLQDFLVRGKKLICVLNYDETTHTCGGEIKKAADGKYRCEFEHLHSAYYIINLPKGME
jgi:hypothetical protein